MGLPSLRQLEYVVMLADAGQFVEAARRCHVSQPALSKQVQEVEALLGVPLFERARPRVLLTPAGEELVRRARRLLADARAMVAAVGAAPRTVHLGVIPTIAPYGLPGLLSRLRDRYPDVSYAVHELQTPVLLEGLQNGSIDLGLLARPLDAPGLHGEDIVFEPFVLVAPAQHSLGIRQAVAPQEIAGESLILMQDGHCLRDQALDLCADAGAAPPTAVTAASVSTLARMVESGLGATLLPATSIADEVYAHQGMVARGFDAPTPGRTLTLRWRATSNDGPWFSEVSALLRAHYLELGARIPKVYGPQPRIRALAPPR